MVFGLLACFWREKATKCARIWTSIARAQAPDADWSHVDRTMVPPRPLGFLLFLAALWMLYLPLHAMFRHVPVSTPRVPSLPVLSHSVDRTSAIAAICFFVMSVYMLIDPIGLYCIFTRQKRDKFPRKGKRGWPVVATALAFITVSGYLLFKVFKH
jgi:hypothetical protein